MSLFPSLPLPNRHLFSLFSSPESCTFYLPPLSPCKEAAAAPAEGCNAASAHPTSPKRIHAAADDPRDMPDTLLQALDPWGWLRWAGGHSPVWLVTGGRLSQYCSWMEAATGLSQRRNACMGREQTGWGYMCSMLLPLPQMPPWVRSELDHVWVGTTPKACTIDMYHLQDDFLGKLLL